MSAHKIQTPGNQPKERKQHSQLGECLKSGILNLLRVMTLSGYRLTRAELFPDMRCNETEEYQTTAIHRMWCAVRHVCTPYMSAKGKKVCKIGKYVSALHIGVFLLRVVKSENFSDFNNTTNRSLLYQFSRKFAKRFSR